MAGDRKGTPKPSSSREDEPPDFGIAVVTGEELVWLRQLGAEAGAFLHTYVPDATEVTLENLDLAFQAWQVSPAPQHTQEEVIQLLGGYLGNKCIDELNMQWVRVSDILGEDYAVRGKTADVIFFPFSAVMKRIGDRECEFLRPIFQIIKHALADPRVRRLDREEPE